MLELASVAVKVLVCSALVTFTLSNLLLVSTYHLKCMLSAMLPTKEGALCVGW